jgi:hypothetical protein
MSCILCNRLPDPQPEDKDVFPQRPAIPIGRLAVWLYRKNPACRAAFKKHSKLTGVFCFSGEQICPTKM